MSDKPEYIIDQMGKWLLLDNGGKELVEPSTEWYENINKSINITPEPSKEDLDKANRQIEILNTLMEVGLL